MGFDLEIFVSDVDDELVCSICGCVFESPVVTPCHHIFCRECLVSWLNTGSESCPECRKKVHCAHLKPAHPVIQGLVESLRVKCPFHENGCQETPLLKDVKQHELECDFVLCACEHEGCAEKVARVHLSEHMDSCPHRRVVCECGALLLHSEKDAHDCVADLRKRVETALRGIHEEEEEHTKVMAALKKQLEEHVLRREEALSEHLRAAESRAIALGYAPPPEVSLPSGSDVQMEQGSGNGVAGNGGLAALPGGGILEEHARAHGYEVSGLKIRLPGDGPKILLCSISSSTARETFTWSLEMCGENIAFVMGVIPESERENDRVFEKDGMIGFKGMSTYHSSMPKHKVQVGSVLSATMDPASREVKFGINVGSDGGEEFAHFIPPEIGEFRFGIVLFKGAAVELKPSH
eukprot:TRINITY_DN538_c0_g1_i1.p1 TRINITY_DN538_c0_g1~~TRINITY_DN538_c0_g1_i1.p1  ORF type:complete len:408 (-),score=118.41 TRINITY_DN538_c0_g1_i1:119-1342(-)